MSTRDPLECSSSVRDRLHVKDSRIGGVFSLIDHEIFIIASHIISVVGGHEKEVIVGIVVIGSWVDIKIFIIDWIISHLDWSRYYRHVPFLNTISIIRENEKSLIRNSQIIPLIISLSGLRSDLGQNSSVIVPNIRDIENQNLVSIGNEKNGFHTARGLDGLWLESLWLRSERTHINVRHWSRGLSEVSEVPNDDSVQELIILLDTVQELIGLPEVGTWSGRIESKLVLQIVDVVKEIDIRVVIWIIDDTIGVLHDDDLLNSVVQNLHLDVDTGDLSGLVTFLEWRAVEPKEGKSIFFEESILKEQGEGSITRLVLKWVGL
jgi:hypothetical protein